MVVECLPADVLDKACKQLDIRLEKSETGPTKACGLETSLNNLKTYLTDALHPASASSPPSMLPIQPASMETPEKENQQHDDETSNPDLGDDKRSLAAARKEGGQAGRWSRQQSHTSADGHPDEASQTDDHAGQAAGADS